MRKSGWAVAGLGSLVLMLTACGGSSDTTSASGTTSQSTSASAPASSSRAVTKPATGSSSSRGTATSTPGPHHTAGPQPSSNLGDQSIPPIGTTVMTVRISNLGYVLAKASGYVVYTYAKDPKGGTPTCTGSCATVWAPVTGVPQVSPGITIPGTFGLVRRTNGVKQITYNGYPLYTYKLAGRQVTTGNGIGGVWYVVKMSASDITG